MRLIVTFASLFLSVIFVQLGSGGVAPLDAISGLDLGFSKTQVGLLGSAHYVGFFVGCWWVPRLMGTIGHARAFAAMTALGTIGIMAHMMMVGPYAWMALRMLTGLSVAGCYTIIEAWLQGSVTNETRGRAMATYRVIDVGASLVAQLMIGVLTPSAYASYNLLAIFCCAALLPMALSRAQQPATGRAPRLRPRLAWTMSPLAAVSVVVSGITGSAFRFVGPVYGAEVGLGLDQIGVFLALYVAGGWVAQLPMGWVADRSDRRSVLIGLSVAAAVISGLTILTAATGSVWAIYAVAALFGFATLPIYSVASAHANDFAETHQRVELAAALMFLYGFGAITSPYLASVLITNFGPSAMFVMLIVVHVAQVGYGLVRMRIGRDPTDRTAYAWVPRTSFLVGRLLGRPRDDE